MATSAVTMSDCVVDKRSILCNSPLTGTERFRGVTVSTLDFESSDPSSNLGGTWQDLAFLRPRRWNTCDPYSNRSAFRRTLYNVCTVLANFDGLTTK